MWTSPHWPPSRGEGPLPNPDALPRQPDLLPAVPGYSPTRLETWGYSPSAANVSSHVF